MLVNTTEQSTVYALVMLLDASVAFNVLVAGVLIYVYYPSCNRVYENIFRKV